MAAKGVTFITNILVIILLMQQYSTNSFYSLFLQHLNFSPSHLGFVRASQIWTSALLVPAWMLLTKEHLTAQGKRIVIAVCIAALMGFYMSLVLFPHFMSCILKDVTHCHSVPSKNTQRFVEVNFNNISAFNESNKAELLPTETITPKYNSSTLTDLKHLSEKTLSNYSQVSSKPSESSTTIIPTASTIVINSLYKFNHKPSKNLSRDTSKETFLRHKQQFFTSEEEQNFTQTSERRTSSVAPAIYLSTEMPNIVHSSNIISDKLEHKMVEANEKPSLYHHYFINNHHSPTVHKSERRKQKIYANDKVSVNDLTQYYNETAQRNSYLPDKNENIEKKHYFEKFRPILDLVSYKLKKLNSNNVPSSLYKNQRLIESSNDNSNDQVSYSAALAKPHRFMNAPHATFSKKKQEDKISEDGFDEKYPNTLPEFISSFNTKHSSYKYLKEINSRNKVNSAKQITDKYDEDLRKMTSLEKNNHVMRKREKPNSYKSLKVINNRNKVNSANQITGKYDEDLRKMTSLEKNNYVMRKREKPNSYKSLKAINNRNKVNSANQITDKDDEDLRKMTSLEKNNHVMQKREKPNSYKSLKTINNRNKVNSVSQITDKYDEDLRKMTSLEKNNHIMQKREKPRYRSTKEKALHSTYPYQERQHSKQSVHSLTEETEETFKYRRHSKRINSEKQIYETPATFRRYSEHKWQMERTRRSKRSKIKDDIEMKNYNLRRLKSVVDFNDSYISRTKIDNGAKIVRFLSFSSDDIYTFSFVFSFVVLAEIFSRGITSVCKRICTENAEVHPHVFNFGLQQWALKIWGIVICPLLMVVVIKVACAYQPRVFFILASFLLMINIPLILCLLPTCNKTEKEMPQKDKNLKSSIGSHILVLVSGFGAACNFEFIFWHMDLQQDFVFNYQLLYCSYLILRAIAQTYIHPSVEHWQEVYANETKTRVLWNIASHATLCLHSLGASYLHPTWTLILLGLLTGCSDSFHSSETASAWWTTGYGFGCLLGGCMVDRYGTELLFQGVAIVMFISCILQSIWYGFSKYYGCGYKRQTVYSKLLLLPEDEEDSSEEEIMEESDDWLERALQKDELSKKKLQCNSGV